MKIYLAGPEVFLPDAIEMGEKKKAICAKYDVIGLYPMDNEVAETDGIKLSTAIYRANIEMIEQADAIVANLTPFRSVSADPGTTFELGYAAALRKGVFGYSNILPNLKDRIELVLGGTTVINNRIIASDNLLVEDFSLFDNLMLAEVLGKTGVIRPQTALADPHRDLIVFEGCVRMAKIKMAAQ